MSKKFNKQYKSETAKKAEVNTILNKPKAVFDKSYLPFILLLIILVITFIAYTTSIFNGLVKWDDYDYITANKFIKSLKFENIKAIFSSFYFANYHPLTTLSWAIEYKFWGESATAMHTTNLIIHLVNTLLAFVLIFKLTKRLEIAFIVSLFFGIHPMHVESVAWIAERKDVLYSLFFLLSMIFYTDYIKKDFKSKHFILTIIMFVFSAFSKSAAITLPLLLIAFDYYLGRKFTAKTLLEKIPFFIVSIIFGILAYEAQKGSGSINAYLTSSYINKIFLMSYAFMFYIIRFFAPIDLTLLHHYPMMSEGMLPSIYYVSIAPTLIIFAFILFLKKYRKLLIFGFSFFIITMLLTLQIVAIGNNVVAERYTYIPYIGLLFIVGKLYADVVDRKIKYSNIVKPAIIILLSIGVAIFITITYNYNKVWKNDISLFKNVIKVDPKHFLNNFCYANALRDNKQMEEAVQYYSASINDKPDFTDAYINRGSTFIDLKNYRAAEYDFETTVKINPQYTLGFFNLGIAQAAQKKDSAAVVAFSNVIKLDPNYVSAYFSRGTSLINIGKYKMALDDYNKSLELDPNFTDVYNNRGNLKAMLKDYKGALEDYNNALKINPQNGGAYLNRGLVNLNLKDKSAACADFQQSVNLGLEEAKEAIRLNCR